MAEAKATITLTLCEIEALIRMGDAAYRYYGQTNTAFDRSVIAKAKKARNSVLCERADRKQTEKSL